MDAHLRDLVLVATGGAAGAVARHVVGRWVGPAQGGVPWHTLVVNVTGAFAIGLLLALAARLGFPGWWRPLLAVGLLGGFTTFSTFSLEIVDLALKGDPGLAAVYAAGSLTLGVAACAVGIAVGRVVA